MGFVTAPEPRTRRCPSCGYRFVVSGDEVYCSAICERAAGMAAVYAGLQRFSSQNR
jgi:hypothetical protein